MRETPTERKAPALLAFVTIAWHGTSPVQVIWTFYGLHSALPLRYSWTSNRFQSFDDRGMFQDRRKEGFSAFLIISVFFLFFSPSLKWPSSQRDRVRRWQVLNGNANRMNWRGALGRTLPKNPALPHRYAVPEEFCLTRCSRRLVQRRT